MNDNKVFSRQLDLVKPDELDFPILIIGAGGIGSWTTLALAKMGCHNITVVDFDKVEDHNIPSQIYTFKYKGEFKVNALKDIVKELTSVEIIPVSQKFQDWYTPDKQFNAIISGVDSVESRRKIWKKISTDIPLKFDVYFDGRMAGEFLRIITISPLNAYSINSYQKNLFADKPVDDTPCTARSVVYNTFLCGGLMASFIKKYAKKEFVKANINFDITNTQIL